MGAVEFPNVQCLIHIMAEINMSSGVRRTRQPEWECFIPGNVTGKSSEYLMGSLRVLSVFELFEGQYKLLHVEV